MNSRRFAWIAGLGCVTLILVVLVGLSGLLFFSNGLGGMFRADHRTSTPTIGVTVADTPEAEAARSMDSVSMPKPTSVQGQEETSEQRVIEGMDRSLMEESSLDALYQDVNPGVVNIQVYVEQAGLQGSTGQRRILGQVVPVGGDIIIEVDGELVEDFTDVLTTVAFRQPGDAVELTVLRDGEQRQVTVVLARRLQNLRG